MCRGVILAVAVARSEIAQLGAVIAIGAIRRVGRWGYVVGRRVGAGRVGRVARPTAVLGSSRDHGGAP